MTFPVTIKLHDYHRLHKICALYQLCKATHPSCHEHPTNSESKCKCNKAQDKKEHLQSFQARSLIPLKTAHQETA